jgi:hypothetical protein
MVGTPTYASCNVAQMDFAQRSLTRCHTCVCCLTLQPLSCLQIQANTLPYMRQQQLEQQHHHQASLQQPPQPAPQPSPGGGSSKAGGRAYRGSRCEVCLRNKKGKCGTKSASMKCHKRKENGLPYYNEQGKVGPWRCGGDRKVLSN